MSKKLGLPLEYQALPEYFDAHNINEDTEAKNAVIEKILAEHNVKTVLDLTCGTGSQVFHLAKKGYSVVGSDFSPDLIQQARKKAKQHKMAITFLDGDMRTLKVGTFDAVITMFNAVGHLTKAGFEKAIRNVAANLKPNGIYVFDIFNVDAMAEETVADFALYHKKTVGDIQIHQMQCSTLDKKTNLLVSYDSYMIQKKAEAPTQYQNKFALQVYSAQELREMLYRNGFEVLDLFDMNGDKFCEKESISILVIAQKK